MKATLFVIGLLLFISCKPVPGTTDVQKEQLVACEMGKDLCQPIKVVRESRDAKTTVRFLISSDRMTMQLLDDNYPKQIAIIHKNEIRPIISDFLTKEGYPGFDLTSLPDGKYFVHIIGNEVGGIFELDIETKNKVGATQKLQ